MRILAVSDMRVQSIAQLEGAAEELRPDLIVYAGDDVSRFGPGPNSWSRLASKTRFGLAGVLGNDCDPVDREVFDQAGCHDLDRTPLLLKGLAVIGLGGAPEGGLGPNLYDEQSAAKRLDRDLKQAGTRPVLLVSHAPPRGVLDTAVRFGVEDIGSTAVRDFVRKRQVRGVVCGHVHSEGRQAHRVRHCVVVNVASDDMPGAQLVYALLDWNGQRFSETLGARGAGPRIYQVDKRLSDRLLEAGIAKLDEVLRISAAQAAELLGPEDAQRARAQALAFKTKEPVLLRRSPALPKAPLFLDVETPFDEPKDPWMVAAKLGGTTPLFQTHELDVEKHAKHLRVVDQFVESVARTHIVQWGSSDRAQLEKAYQRTKLPVPEWTDAEHWINAIHVLKDVVAIPSMSWELKDVAGVFGYRFREPDLHGRLVGKWASKFRETGEAFDLERVRRYNADDVLSMEHIFSAVVRLAAAKKTLFEPVIEARISRPWRQAVKPARKRRRPSAQEVDEYEMSQLELHRAGRISFEEFDRRMSKFISGEAQGPETPRGKHAEVVPLRERERRAQKFQAGLLKRVRAGSMTQEAFERGVANFAASLSGDAGARVSKPSARTSDEKWEQTIQKFRASQEKRVTAGLMTKEACEKAVENYARRGRPVSSGGPQI